MNKLISESGIVSYKIKTDIDKPIINYDIIQSALNIEGLTAENGMSNADATAQFVKLMKEIDSSSMKSKLNIKNKSQNPVKKPITNNVSIIDHDIKQYTKLFHPIKIQADEKKPLKDRLKKLNHLCQKMPFERSTSEVDNIYRILKTISTLCCQVDDELLKLLSNIAIYERIEEPGVTIFGNKGFYILLKGSIRPLAVPSVKMIGEPIERFNLPRNQKTQYSNLFPGECFGTLDEIIIEDVDCSKYLLAETMEPSELIFITTSYYRRILEKYNTQKHADKLTLLKRQEAFTVWPHQALVKIANIFSWAVIPANTLICKEDEISPILAFIQNGSCYVLRKLEVKETLPNGKTIIKISQVIVGTLEKNKSMGEVSLLDKIPMKHSLLTKEDIRVIQTDKSKLADLDFDVKSLLRQSCSPEFYHITKADVENIYMKQKSQKDWAHFKENVISEVIDARGIRPGQGKWSIIPNQQDLF